MLAKPANRECRSRARPSLTLLKLTLEHEDGMVFSFNQADQIDFDAVTPECNYMPKR